MDINELREEIKKRCSKKSKEELLEIFSNFHTKEKIEKQYSKKSKEELSEIFSDSFIKMMKCFANSDRIWDNLEKNIK